MNLHKIFLNISPFQAYFDERIYILSCLMLSSSSYNFLRASLSSSSYFANAVINIVVVVLVTFDFLLLTDEY